MNQRILGGRSARIAQRQAPLSDDMRPIRPGMVGGKMRVLSDLDKVKIHNAVVEILETIGYADALPSTIAYCCRAGAFVNANGRLCFPRTLIEDTIATAGRGLTLYAQDEQWDIHPHSGRVYFGTSGAAVNTLELDSNNYRPSTMLDLYHAAKLVDNLDNIHILQRPLVCRDISDPFLMDFNTCYASVRGTRKHVGTSWVDLPQFAESMKMLYDIAGGEDKWNARPFVSISSCFVVPPLKFAQDACKCLEAAVKVNMPLLLVSAGQAGATAPAALAGAVALSIAEVLAAVIYANAVKKGATFMFSPWPFVSDLRTGAMSGGSAEQALLMNGTAEMSAHYGFTTCVAAAMADSKTPDYQSGAEKALTTVMNANSGANMIYEAAGMQASILGFCHEALVLDNDMLGSVMRIVRGIEVNDDTLSVEVIRQTCLGVEGKPAVGHFLGSEQTMRLMQRDYYYPKLFDRTSPKEWAANGKPALLTRATQLKNDILAGPPHPFISTEMDEKLRAKYPILLPRESL